MKSTKIKILFKYLFIVKFTNKNYIFRILSTTDFTLIVFSLLIIILGTYNSPLFGLNQSILFLGGNFCLLTYRYVRFAVFSKEQESTNQIIATIPFKKHNIYLVNVLLKFLYLLKIVLVISFLQTIYITIKFNYISAFKYFYFVIITGMIVSVFVEIFRILFHALSYKIYFSRYFAAPLIIMFSLIFSFLLRHIYPVKYFILNVFSNNLFLIVVIPISSTLLFILSLLKNNFNLKIKIKKRKIFNFSNIYDKTNVEFDNVVRRRDLYQIFMLSTSIILPFYDAIISLILINSFNFSISLKEIIFCTFIISISGLATLVYSVLYCEYPKSIEMLEYIPSFNKKAVVFNRINRIMIFMIFPSLIISLFFGWFAPMYFLILMGLSGFFLIIACLFLNKEKIYYYSPYNANEGPNQIVMALLNVVLSSIIVVLLIFFNFNLYLLIGFSIISIIMIIIYFFLNNNYKYARLYKNFRQFSNLDCGLAAIRTMIFTKGVLISKIEAEDIFKKYGKKEFSFQTLCEIAKTKGLLIEGYYCENFNNYYEKIEYPIIAQIKVMNQMHFIVVFEINCNYAFIGDPNSFKSKTIKIKKLMKKMTGNILVFE